MCNATWWSYIITTLIGGLMGIGMMALMLFFVLRRKGTFTILQEKNDD